MPLQVCICAVMFRSVYFNQFLFEHMLVKGLNYFVNLKYVYVRQAQNLKTLVIKNNHTHAYCL